MSASTELRPLAGLRVLDFTQIGAGPLCGMYLADLGADVVKLEPPGGEIGRTLGLPWVGDESPMNVSFNRGKRSLCVDLKNPDGVAIVRHLAQGADVILESFRPGVMKQFGLDADSLRADKPQLVYCSVSAYGQTGPLSTQPGVDGIVQATSGLMSLIGSDDQAPCKVQAPIVDVATGMIATLGVLAQLLQRERGGEGGVLDINLFSSAVALQQSALTTFLGSGELPKPMGSAAPYAAPNEAFRTGDGWIMVAAYNGDRWPRLCATLGLEGAAKDPRLATLDQRLVHRTLMHELLAPCFASRSTDEWMGLLQAADIVCGKVSDYADLARNPQVKHLRLLEPVASASGREFMVPALPVNSATRPARTASVARCGSHTCEVLAEAGYSPAEIEQLLVRNAAVQAAAIHRQQAGHPV